MISNVKDDQVEFQYMGLTWRSCIETRLKVKTIKKENMNQSREMNLARKQQSLPTMADPSGRNWYALYTRPNFEKRVDNNLKRINLHSYLPLRSQLRQWSDRKKLIQVPLFSCYVFVFANPMERLMSLKANGVVRMLGNGGQPSRIPENEIETIRRIVADNCDPVQVPTVIPGDRVEIIAGPLTGLRGVLREIYGQQRFIITFESIGQSVAINIDSLQIKKVAGKEMHHNDMTSVKRIM